MLRKGKRTTRTAPSILRRRASRSMHRTTQDFHSRPSKAARRALEDLLASLADRARPVCIVAKDDRRLQRAIGWALFALTFGGQRTYLTRYVTTLGHTIYVPRGFADWRPEDAL